MFGNAAETSGKWRPEEEVDDKILRQLFGDGKLNNIDRAIVGATVVTPKLSVKEIAMLSGRVPQTITNRTTALRRLAEERGFDCSDRHNLGDLYFSLEQKTNS